MTSDAKNERWVGKLLRSIGSLAVAVLVLEGLARLDDAVTWGAPFWGPYSYEVLNLFDERGVSSVRGRPGARYQKWQQNALGFRGPEVSKDKPPGVKRVFLAGASEIFGLQESPGNELPAQLQRELDRRRPGRYQVINAGRAGLSPPRFPHYFRSWLRQLDPDVIVYYPTPHFYLDEIPPSFTVPAEKRPRAPRHLPRIVEKAKTLLRQATPPALRMQLNRLSLHLRRRGHGPDWVWREVPAERVARYRAHLAAIVEAVREDTRVELQLCLHANRFPRELTRLDERQLLALEVEYPRASPRALLEIDGAINRVTREVAAARGLPLIDLQGKLGKRPELYADFSHFTDRGAAEAAGIIADALLQGR